MQGPAWVCRGPGQASKRQRILRVVIFDILARSDRGVIVQAGLPWEGAGAGARPIWIAQLADLALSPMLFALLCCKFS